MAKRVFERIVYFQYETHVLPRLCDTNINADFFLVAFQIA